MVPTFVLCLSLVAFMGSTAGQFVQSSSFYNSGPISVFQINGVTRYLIDGVPLDLKRAAIVGENAEVQVLQPHEAPAARVKVYKTRNIITIDYLGNHFESSENGHFIRQWTST